MASTVPRPPTAHRWLLVLPFVWQVGLVPVVNGVRLAPLNIPFPMLWQMLGVLASTAVIALVFRLDRRAGVDAEEDRFLELTESVRVDDTTSDGEAS